MTLTDEIVLTACPVAAILLGGILAARWPPTAMLQSAVQHVAAGAVVAAVATEIIPEIVHTEQTGAVVVGFLAGTVAMVTLNAISTRIEQSRGSARAFGLAAATAVDVAVDGLVLGLGFAAGHKQGLLLAVALTLELVFLGLAVAAEISDKPRIVLLSAATLAGVFSIAVVVGVQLGNLSARPFTALLAFGSAALLYLVTEELLTEAHETPDHPLMPSLFLLAFLGVLVVDMTT